MNRLNQPLVSIIVPSYNHKKFIDDRLQSIFSQDCPHIELIILDDCSSDGSVLYMRELLAKEGIPHRLLENTVNSGSVFKQWDNGVSLATGKYVWIAESDDYCSDDFLSTLIPAMEASNSVLGFTESRLVDSTSSCIGSTVDYGDNLDPWMSRNDFVIPGMTLVSLFLSVQCLLPNASAVVFRRDCYEFGLAERFGLKLSGDWLQWIAIASKGQVVHKKNLLNSFRQHSGSVRIATQDLAQREALICTNFALKMLKGDERRAFLLQVGMRLRARWRFSMPLMLIKQPRLYSQRLIVLSNICKMSAVSLISKDLVKLLSKPFCVIIRILFKQRF